MPGSPPLRFAVRHLPPHRMNALYSGSSDGLGASSGARWDTSEMAERHTRPTGDERYLRLGPGEQCDDHAPRMTGLNAGLFMAALCLGREHAQAERPGQMAGR